MNVKNALRRWLGIREASLSEEHDAIKAAAIARGNRTRFMLGVARLEYALRQFETVKVQVLDQQARLDALCEALGIVITVDPTKPGTADVASIREDGLAKDAREYIAAVAAVTTTLLRQTRLLDGFARETSSLLRPLIRDRQSQPRTP